MKLGFFVGEHDTMQRELPTRIVMIVSHADTTALNDKMMDRALGAISKQKA